MNNLKQIRQEHGLSREALSKVSGVKARSIKSWEDGQVALENASYSAIKAISKALEVEPDDLFVNAVW